MSTTLYVIIGPVLLVILQFFVTRTYAKKRLQGQIGHINQTPLTEEQKRLLTYGAYWLIIAVRASQALCLKRY